MDFIDMLQKIIDSLDKIISLLDKQSNKIIQLPQVDQADDKLIRAAEAARILNVGKQTVYWYVSEGLLNAYYTAGSPHKKFWLSEVKAVAKRRSDYNL